MKGMVPGSPRTGWLAVQAAVSLAEEGVECLQASSMLGPVVLLEKAHRNAQRSERNPTDQGREREAAAAVGVGSRGNASSSGCKDTTRSGGDGGDP